jgi:hypothetical protein
MISQGLESRGWRIESAASIEKISDHSPLLIWIWGQATDPVNPSYYFRVVSRIVQKFFFLSLKLSWIVVESSMARRSTNLNSEAKQNTR